MGVKRLGVKRPGRQQLGSETTATLFERPWKNTGMAKNYTPCKECTYIRICTVDKDVTYS